MKEVIMLALQRGLTSTLRLYFTLYNNVTCIILYVMPSKVEFTGTQSRGIMLKLYDVYL